MLVKECSWNLKKKKKKNNLFEYMSWHKGNLLKV